MSAQQLSDRCAALGLPIARAVIANLESGRRTGLTVAELLVLAAALDVSPLSLLFRLGSAESVEALPGREVPAWQALMWASGEAPFPGEHPSPSTADSFHVSAYGRRIYASSHDPAGTYRVHEELISDVLRTRESAAAVRATAHRAESAEARDAWLRAADAEDARANQLAQSIRRARREFRRGGMTPPQLPDELRHLDDEEDSQTA